MRLVTRLQPPRAPGAVSPTAGLPPAQRLTLAVVALAGAIAVALPASRHGIGLTPDSASYVSAARSLARGAGALLFDGRPMTLWPPLYPALLAAVQLVTGLDPLATAPFVGAVLFGLTIGLTGLLFARTLGASIGIVLVGGLAALCSKALVSHFLQAESGSLFVPLALACLIALIHHLDTGRRRDVAMAAVTAGAAALTRYTGVVLVALGAAAILFGTGSPWRARLRDTLGFSLVSVLPLLLWAIRNERIDGAPFGPRAPSEVSFGVDASTAIVVITSWFAPLGHLPRGFGVALAGAALLGLVFLGVREVGRRGPRSRGGPLLFAYVAGYAGFVVLASSAIAVDRLNTRLLMPVYPPLAMLFVAGVLGLGRVSGAAPAHRAAAGWTAVALAVWLAWSAHQGSDVMRGYVRSGGWGYNGVRWRTSATLVQLREDPALAGAFVYSNAPGAVYLLADRPSWDSAEKTMYRSAQRVRTPSELRGSWPSRLPALLAWFDGVEEPSLYTTGELKGFADLDAVARLEDGTIYRLRRQP